MILIVIEFAIIMINLLILIYRYGCALYNVQEIILSNNLWYILVASLLPFLWWIYSTKEDEWNFYSRKKTTLMICILNATLCVAQTAWTITFDLIVSRICTIPIGRNMDKEMVFALCRIVLGIVAISLVYSVYELMRRLYENEEIRENIKTVRWQHLVDTRKNKKTAYDLDILRKLDDGKSAVIYEVDRFVHMFILGASGTGKTSSTFLPSIVCDLNKKIENMVSRLELLSIFLKNGKGIAYKKPNKVLDEYDIVATNAKNRKELEVIRSKYPDCGVTAIAPDNSSNIEIIKLAEARKISVNVIDPLYTYQNKNVRMCGLNPFYVPIGLEPEVRVTQIINNARNFADVLLAVSEIHGLGDQYFRDINETVTTNVSIVCMLYANLNGKQTNITQIQSCITDFGKLKVIVKDIQEKLRIQVVVHEVVQKNNSLRQDAKKPDRSTMPSPDIDGFEAEDIIFYEITSEDEIPVEYRQKGFTIDQYNQILKEEGKNYAGHIHFVLSELLGNGAEAMFQQARGLRNILDKFLNDPRIRKVLSAPDDMMLDLDKILSNGEVTVVNTGLELGATSSTALGLFFLLSFKLATLRRPAENRTNHFIYIDEAAQYMHQMYEDMFVIFRKYKVGVVVAIQSLSQMDKTSTTEHLKGVIMGAGIHIVFGRTDPDTMKYYEEISGITHSETVQIQTSANSEFDDDYNISSGRRKTNEDKQAVEGHQIRIRDFLEVTVYMVRQGRVLKGFHAKTRFTKKSDYAEKKIKKINLSKYSKEDPNSQYIRERSEGNEEASTLIKTNHYIGQKVVNLRNEEDVIERLPSLSGVEKKESQDRSELIKQRTGKINMLIDSINTSTYSVAVNDDVHIESFEPLNASLLGPKKKTVESRKKSRAEEVKKKEPVNKNTNEELDLCDLLELENETNTFKEKEESQAVEELDEMAILQAEIDKLNGERRG